MIMVTETEKYIARLAKLPMRFKALGDLLIENDEGRIITMHDNNLRYLDSKWHSNIPGHIIHIITKSEMVTNAMSYSKKRTLISYMIFPVQKYMLDLWAGHYQTWWDNAYGVDMFYDSRAYGLKHNVSLSLSIVGRHFHGVAKRLLKS